MGCLGVLVVSILLGSSLQPVNGAQLNAGSTTTGKNLRYGGQEKTNGGAEVKVKQNVDVCRWKSCGRGRECVYPADTGRVECVCQQRCQNSFVPVCGSDGHFYQNHCELHRAACVQNRRIHTLNDTRCFLTGGTCTMSEYNRLKSILLDLQPVKIIDKEQTHEKPMAKRRRQVDSMFKSFDRNKDGRVSSEELEEISAKERLENLLLQCSIQDLLRYDDYNSDAQLTLQELYTAFQVIDLSLAPDLLLSISTVSVGLSTILSCAIQGNLRPRIVWKRNGITLNLLELEDINDFGDDGSLYIMKVTTVHIGKYTCHAEGYEELIQTHMLQVNVPPVILVYPESQAQEPGVAASLRCHADGIPEPSLSWLKNGLELQPHTNKHLSLTANGTEILISSVRYEDTGAYSCIARNDVGVDEDISSLFVEDSARKTLANILWREEGLSVGNMFYIFSSDGITIVQPGDCEIRRRLTPTEKILGSHAELCPSGECVWASAISVKDKLLYVSQPLRDRLLVIDTRTQRVLEAVKTDAMPVKVFYDKSHDQIFVLSWRHRLRRHSTLQVITSASSLEKHQIVHTPFQSVRGFYIPPTNLIITHVRFGFVFLKREAAVHKIDLETLQPVKTISLLDHSCVPTSMAYTHLSGYYLIECQPRNHSSSSWQLLIDGMSDSVIGRNPNINGKPFVTPNGRFVVSVDEKQGKLYTQRVSFLGELQLHHETDLYVAVADLEFHPSITDANQYTVVVTSTEDSQLVFMDLFSGETKFLESVKEPIDASSWHWGSGNRVVKSSGIFGRYLVTPALESVFILDGEQKGVRCEISGIRKGNTVVWVGEV